MFFSIYFFQDLFSSILVQSCECVVSVCEVLDYMVEYVVQNIFVMWFVGFFVFGIIEKVLEEKKQGERRGFSGFCFYNVVVFWSF